MPSPEIPENERVLRLLQQTDEAKFIEALFKAHYAALCRTAFRVVGDRDAAEDLVQDVFVKIWNGRQTLHITTSLKAYLHRSAVNASLNYLEKHKRQVNLEPEALSNLAPAVDSLEEALSLKEVEARVEEAIQALPPACRTIFVLSRYEAMSYQEIADALELSVKTVENQMGKALKTMRHYLKAYVRHLFSALL
ncbi:MAG: RNA polymerase sigma-70 factor [Ferruginibacter sp.]|nr:RNA polymerase sigma-70 factor [Cytophagales bacterium]